MGSRYSSVRSPALPLQMGHASSPLESSSLEPAGRRAGSELGVVTDVTVSTCCQQGKLSEAVGALESLAQTGSAVSQSLCYTVLKLCTARKDLVVGRRVHGLTVKLGYESNAYLGNHILRMYACGSRLKEAMDVFNRVGKPNVFLWFSIISAHATHRKPQEAIHLYREMRRSGVKADVYQPCDKAIKSQPPCVSLLSAVPDQKTMPSHQRCGPDENAHAHHLANITLHKKLGLTGEPTSGFVRYAANLAMMINE